MRLERLGEPRDGAVVGRRAPEDRLARVERACLAPRLAQPRLERARLGGGGGGDGRRAREARVGASAIGGARARRGGRLGERLGLLGERGLARAHLVGELRLLDAQQLGRLGGGAREARGPAHPRQAVARLVVGQQVAHLLERVVPRLG